MLKTSSEDDRGEDEDGNDELDNNYFAIKEESISLLLEKTLMKTREELMEIMDTMDYLKH